MKYDNFNKETNKVIKDWIIKLKGNIQFNKETINRFTEEVDIIQNKIDILEAILEN